MTGKDNRTGIIKARVTPEERLRVEQTAAGFDVSVSDLIRTFVLDAPDRSGLSADDRNSLNLIVRYLRQNRDSAPVLARLMALIERIDALLA